MHSIWGKRSLSRRGRLSYIPAFRMLQKEKFTNARDCFSKVIWEGKGINYVCVIQTWAPSRFPQLAVRTVPSIVSWRIPKKLASLISVNNSMGQPATPCPQKRPI